MSLALVTKNEAGPIPPSPYRRGRVHRFPSGERVRIMAVTSDDETDEVVLILESLGPVYCVSDMSVSEFVALRPKPEEPVG